MRQRAAMHMQMAELGAAMQLGKLLAGIEQPVRIESAFHALLLTEIRLAEHDAHEIALLHAHAMLSREHAADLAVTRAAPVAEASQAAPEGVLASRPKKGT